MKIAIVFVLVLVLAFSLSACDASVSGIDSTTPQQTEGTVPTEPPISTEPSEPIPTEETTPVETEPALDTSWATNEFEMQIPNYNTIVAGGWDEYKTIEATRYEVWNVFTYTDLAPYVASLSDWGFVNNVREDDQMEEDFKKYNFYAENNSGYSVEINLGIGNTEGDEGRGYIVVTKLS